MKFFNIFSLSILFLLSGLFSRLPLSFAADASSSVVHFGDSLTVGMYQQGLADKYKAAGLIPIIPGNNPDGTGGCSDGYKAGFPCKGVQAAIASIDNHKDSISSASVVVVEMGTNMVEGSAGAFKTAMFQFIDKVRSINPNVKIYWVNLAAKVNIDQYSERNKVIDEVAKEKSIFVIDWFHKVFPSGDPENIKADLIDSNNWFAGADGVHLTANGYQAMADAVAGGLSSSASSGNGNTQNNSSSAEAVSCYLTTVGNPINPPPPLPPECPVPSSVSNNGLVKIAQSIKDAYTACGHRRDDDQGGYTYVNIENLTSCLEKDLKDSGYTDEDINTFTIRKGTSIAGGCTQCLGYVGEAVAVLTKDTSALTGYGTAAQVDAPNAFTYGGSTWTKIDHAEPIQPGDIGVSTIGSAGHILIVKEVTHNGTHFIALESNADLTCRVTDGRETPRNNYDDFFRKQ